MNLEQYLDCTPNNLEVRKERVSTFASTVEVPLLLTLFYFQQGAVGTWGAKADEDFERGVVPKRDWKRYLAKFVELSNSTRCETQETQEKMARCAWRLWQCWYFEKGKKVTMQEIIQEIVET